MKKQPKSYFAFCVQDFIIFRFQNNLGLTLVYIKMKNTFGSILLVDDDDICIFICKKMLQEVGVTDHIFSATNGLEALQFLQQNAETEPILSPEPKLIILDINMPVMNGFEFLKALEETTLNTDDHIKIILLTSSNNLNDLIESARYNVKAYLTKPLTVDQVRKTLEKIA